MSKEIEVEVIDPQDEPVIEIDTSDTSLAVMPAMSLEQADERYALFTSFVKGQMKEGKDFGTIPGTPKPTLYKPGAEKLATFFNFDIRYPPEMEKSIERWDEDAPFFYYKYRCQVMRGDRIIAELDGSCNSRENRYAWRWVSALDVSPNIDKKTLETKVSSVGHFRWQIDKAETTGEYGKPEEYWQKFRDAMENKSAKSETKKQHWDGKDSEYISIESVVYRIPNPEIFSLVNTIQKMAQKRAQVGAVILAANASEFFTQDLEDNPSAFGMSDPQPVEKSEKKTVQQDLPAPVALDFSKIKNNEDALATAKTLIDDTTMPISSATFWSFGERFRFDESHLNDVVGESLTPMTDGRNRTNFRKALTTLHTEAQTALESTGE